jgi:tetratricopeptide (TPR) repeat protein
MKIRSIITLLCIVLIASASGQGNVLPLTGKAARLYEQKNYTEAKTVIEQSISGEGKEDSYSWHVRGHIYKEIYKGQDLAVKKTAKEREVAVESFERCLKLDTEKKFLEWNKTSLRFLGSTYWNDAVSLMEIRDRKDLPMAEDFFHKYLRIMESIEIQSDLNQRKRDFYKAYATSNRKIIEDLRNTMADPTAYSVELERVVDSHKKALAIDNNDYGSNYNYAINLYNEAAYRIENIPAEADLTHIILEQEGCIAIFEEALPIAQKAENLKPGRIEILKALRAIYLGLNNYEAFDKYNDLIREKQGEQIIQKRSQDALNKEIFKNRLNVD